MKKAHFISESPQGDLTWKRKSPALSVLVHILLAYTRLNKQIDGGDDARDRLTNSRNSKCYEYE